MKIGIVNNLYKPFNRGGAERITEVIAEKLSEENEVFVISSKPYFSSIKSRPNGVYYIPSLYSHLREIPYIIRIFWHFYDLIDVVTYFKIKKIIRQEKPDVLITNNLKGLNLLFIKILNKKNIKHIHILHDVQLFNPSGIIICENVHKKDNIFYQIYYNIARIIIASPEIVISPSQWLLEEHLNRGFFKKSKKEIVLNPIEVVNTEYVIKKNEKFKFLFVGQLEIHKGIIFLIKSFNLLCEKSSKNYCSLDIVGSGSELNSSKKIASDNVSFLGKKDKNEIIKLMKEADCLVMPSLCQENSPTVIYEAANVGLPVIASRTGGTEELVHKLGGMLFESGNEGDLMYQMKWALSNKETLLSISEKQLKEIQNLSSDNYIKRINKLL